MPIYGTSRSPQERFHVPNIFSMRPRTLWIGPLIALSFDVLKVQLADVAAYDRFYKRLTSRISVSDISASFVMEEIKDTTALPL